MKEEIMFLNEILRCFAEDTNGYLPEDDGSYEEPWDIKDAQVIGVYISETVSKILDTKIGEHFSYKLTRIRSEYSKCLEDKDIKGCQRVLQDMRKQCRELCIVMREVSK